MNWDEFKATKDSSGKMAFIILNNQSGNIFDILDSRKSRDLMKYFKKEISQKQIVQYLVNTDPTLKSSYDCYQGIINSIKNRDFNKFQNIITHTNPNLSPKMKQAIRLYNQHIKYIENSFKYDINNGVIEGANNLIKCIKRIAFGYRIFNHFISRIFLIKTNLKG